jgi:outer membrane protein OmpA-like peptidoglycan-associated protein
MSRSCYPLLFVVAVALLGGCATSSTVQTRTDEIEKLLHKIHGPATVCAPKDLAYAEALVDVSRYESERGETVLADIHMRDGSDRAADAWKGSRGPECEVDSDFDGIVDSKDECINDPEDYDGMEDEDGCPEEDRDRDGISDRKDKCPDSPEDRDGWEDEDGCPDNDNDADGIADTSDQCPNQAEDRDGHQDQDGCPDPDNDGDGIADIADRCPNEPEDMDGDEDTDGCPDLYKNIVVENDQIKLKQKVFFATNKATIMAQSFEMLNEISDVLMKNPSWVVRVEGHTDSRGNDKYNKKLSQKRADSVRTYLIQHSVDPKAMIAIGYGEEQPIGDNSTEEGRDINRRVEFHIVSK